MATSRDIHQRRYMWDDYLKIEQEIEEIEH